MIVSLLVLKTTGAKTSVGSGLAVTGAVFVLPFLLFSGYAGQAADRWSKTTVLRTAKASEVAILGLGLLAISCQSGGWIFGVLFLLAAKGAFFSPAQSGIIPELLPKTQLSRANGLIFLLSFAALVLGPSLASFLPEIWEHQRWKWGFPLVALSVIGWIASFSIPSVAGASVAAPFRWNPFSEIVQGFRDIPFNPALRIPAFGSSYFWFVGALLQITILLLCVERLHAENRMVGYALGILSLGLGAGSLAAALISKDRMDSGIVPVACFLLGVLSLFLSNASSVVSVLVLLAAIGFSGGLFIVPLNVALQFHSSHTRRGRVLATTNFLNMLGVVLASGVICVFHSFLGFSAGTILITEGLLTLFISALMIVWAPEPFIRFLLTCLTSILFRIRTINPVNIPSAGGALLVANHVSFADAFVLSCALERRIRFVMLRQYFELPGLTWMFRLLGAIPISNGRPSKAALRALDQAAQCIKDGDLVCIFPEGRRTRTGSLEPFRRGIERVAELVAENPILPVYVQGLWGIPSSFKKRKGLRDYVMLRRAVTVTVGPSIEDPVTTKSLQRLVQELAPQTQEVAEDFLPHDEVALSLNCASRMVTREPCPVCVRRFRSTRNNEFGELIRS
jgi:acyl-[acyl-carrier-protein]-phospholipid O-acyltransferase/long-chain-fatty-acid--[acyl-carrier-protein] ligase